MFLFLYNFKENLKEKTGSGNGGRSKRQRGITFNLGKRVSPKVKLTSKVKT